MATFLENLAKPMKFPSELLAFKWFPIPKILLPLVLTLIVPDNLDFLSIAKTKFSFLLIRLLKIFY